MVRINSDIRALIRFGVTEAAVARYSGCYFSRGSGFEKAQWPGQDKSLDFCMLSEFSVETGISGAPNNQIQLPCGGSCVTPAVE
jgi:hypothetical protein